MPQWPGSPGAAFILSLALGPSERKVQVQVACLEVTSGSAGDNSGGEAEVRQKDSKPKPAVDLFAMGIWSRDQLGTSKRHTSAMSFTKEKSPPCVTSTAREPCLP